MGLYLQKTAMVREIIHVQVGQCGNQTGCAFFSAMFGEHSLNNDGRYQPPAAEAKDDDGDGLPDELENIDVYFRGTTEEKKNAKWIPRAVLVDLEPGTMDVIKASAIGPVFKPDNMVFGNNGAGNNWAKGHYTEGAELVESVLDRVRLEVEQCDCPQGFQICQSLGGGTGSGMGTLVLLKLRDAYPDRILATFSVYPSPKVSDTVVEPYNAVLSTHQLLENSDETFIIDNEALMNIQHNVLKVTTDADFKKMNSLIAKVSAGVTCPLRFQGSINADLRKLGTNLVPFPRLHFFMIGESPLEEVANKSYNLQTCVSSVMQKSHAFSNCEYESGKTMAASITFRTSEINQKKCEEEVTKNQNKNKGQGLMVEWIPNNFKIGVVGASRLDTDLSATSVVNTTALKVIFQRLATQFGALFKRKAFLHWYKGEGMDEMEFQEADKNVRDLITEYQDKENAKYQEDSEEAGSEADS